MSRTAFLGVRNDRKHEVVVWEPCLVERKTNGTIVVGSRRTSGTVLGVLSGSSARIPFQMMIPVQLTGNDRGAWRAIVPVSRYWIAGSVERLLGKPRGWALKSPVVAFALQHFSTRIVSTWMDEPDEDTWPPRLGLAGRGSVPHDEFRSMLRVFHQELGRWPSNYVEINNFAVARKIGAPPKEFMDANMVTNPQGLLEVTYARGRMTLSPGRPPSSLIPGAAQSFRRDAARFAERMRALQKRSSEQQDDFTTFQFVVSNFKVHHQRWPTNIVELARFCARHTQPAIPARYTNAVLTPLGVGGLEIVFNDGHGRMSLGQPPPRMVPPQPTPPTEVKAEFAKRREDVNSFQVLLFKFRATHQRWPTNVAEVTVFCAESDQQSTVPLRFADAVLSTTDAGGIQVTYGQGAGRFFLASPITEPHATDASGAKVKR